jgi:hypothetical protein
MLKPTDKVSFGLITRTHHDKARTDTPNRMTRAEDFEFSVPL